MPTLGAEHAKAWVLTVSAAVSMVSVAVSAWVAVGQYGINSEAELRLQRSEQAETEARIAELFVQLARLAQAREAAEVSDACVGALIGAGLFNDTHLDDFDNLGNNRRLSSACMFNMPVGLAAQRGAIVAMSDLGCRYDFLRRSASEALRELAAEGIEPDLAQMEMARLGSAACRS